MSEKIISIAHNIICKNKGKEYAPNKDELQDIIDRLVFYEGEWYLWEKKMARDRIDYCIASKNPKEYNNGYYLYSTKDPGSAKQHVITDTSNIILKAQLLITQH